MRLPVGKVVSVVTDTVGSVIALAARQLDLLMNDDSHHNQVTFTVAEKACYAACQMLITWWPFFPHRNVPISVICDYTSTTVPYLNLLLISFRAGGSLVLSLSVSLWNQSVKTDGLSLQWQCSIYLYFWGSEDLLMAWTQNCSACSALLDCERKRVCKLRLNLWNLVRQIKLVLMSIDWLKSNIITLLIN